MCSPRPYRFGESGRAVLKRRYCVSNTRLAAEVSNKVSLVALRLIAKENGVSVQVNVKADVSALAPSSLDGRGQTDSWI